MQADNYRGPIAAEDVIAESPTGDENNVVMASARTDSPRLSPGINGWGSGAAALLSVARAMRHTKPANKVRFAFWGATALHSASPTSSIRSAAHYLDALSAEDRKKIAAYVSVESLGSRNGGSFVDSGDGAVGSAAINAAVVGVYQKHKWPFFAGPFTDVPDKFFAKDSGIASGGLDTGDTDLKTADQATTFGGQADKPYDPCARLACDDLNNVDFSLLTKEFTVVKELVAQLSAAVSAIRKLQQKP